MGELMISFGVFFLSALCVASIILIIGRILLFKKGYRAEMKRINKEARRSRDRLYGGKLSDDELLAELQEYLEANDEEFTTWLRDRK